MSGSATCSIPLGQGARRTHARHVLAMPEPRRPRLSPLINTAFMRRERGLLADSRLSLERNEEFRDQREAESAMEGEEGTQTQQLILANKIFLLTHPDVDDLQKVRLRDEVFNAVVANDMAPLYQTLIANSVLNLDQKVLDSMRAKIDEELKKLDEKIADAEENLGESEVREAHLAKSLFFIRIGDKDKALEQLKVTESKTVAVGQKMDLVFYTLQMGFFDMDFDLISKSIDRAKNLFEEGGDWERKNRLKVYEGLFCMSTRNFKRAANLFLDSISTFTTYELFPYDTFIFYTVLTSIITLDRVSLKQKVVDAPEILTVIGKIPYLSEFLNSLYDCQYKAFFSAFDMAPLYQTLIGNSVLNLDQKVVDAPEILTVIGKIPYLSEFLNSLYDCQYKAFFSAFAGITEHIKLDRYLHPHFRYYMREVRTVVYSQFLESYKSVTIEAMAKAFGVSEDFIDTELSRFIAAGKLHCKIDKVAGVLETNRPDAKNALYQATIKQGDFLLNRIQKLSRVIDL
nr:26S proteasome non-ATPase regulatory subunit 6 homolog [Ipomoea batatas]